MNSKKALNVMLLTYASFAAGVVCIGIAQGFLTALGVALIIYGFLRNEDIATALNEKN